MYRLLHKYALNNYLEQYILHGHFPTKTAWANLVKENITTVKRRILLSDIDYQELTVHYPSLFDPLKPCSIWFRAKRNPKIRLHCKNTINMLGRLFSRDFPTVCVKCGYLTHNIAVHRLLHCEFDQQARSSLWSDIITTFGLHVYLDHMQNDPRKQVCDLMTGFERCTNLHADWFVAKVVFLISSIFWRQF